jgi:hypothetical protein
VTSESSPPRCIAFGAFPAWEGAIRGRLDARFAPSFVDLTDARPEDFDAVVPLAHAHYDALARRPDLLGRKFLHPSLEAVALCRDKLALTRFLIANGLGEFTPPLRAPGPPYPYIWKRRWGGWGRECHVIDGPAAEREHDLGDEAWFAQDPVVGRTEYATHVLRVGGQIRYVLTVTHEMAGDLVIVGERHPSRPVSAVRGCQHLALFAEILRLIDYEGVACFDYKVVYGQPRIFEINPRYGASLCLDITAFVDAYLAALQPS